ncbi:MAG: hypothetical protein HYS21_02200 [Deltaproteobacteria bacterium]|nr:hypothetical protein [Deltaproteobacteria bacterium]
MNIYIIFEGENGIKKLYIDWIQLINPVLNYVSDISQIDNNNFYIIAGMGYPFYLEMISAGIEDVKNNKKFNRLVIIVDSEGMSFEEKKLEIQSEIDKNGYVFDYHIVVQHFCFETWALGNRRIFRGKIKNPKLREYKRIYDVLNNDPELLPDLKDGDINRAQFAYKYLRLILQEKFRNLTYTKSNPGPVNHPTYFSEIKKRFDETGHTASFEHFLNAFV